MTNFVGEGIRRRRKDRGLTQIELAERIGVVQPMISDMERGKHWPHYSTLRRVADALGCQVEEFFEEPDGRPKVPQLPDTPLASLLPGAIDERLTTLDEPDDLVTLRAEIDQERDALSAWLQAYRSAPQPEQFARRADAELARQRRASLTLYRMAAFDRYSKLLDRRGAFKPVAQIAVEAVEGHAMLQALVESKEARERIETAGETA